MRPISETIFIAPQIDPAALTHFKEMGFTTIINNRGEGESPDQPPTDFMKEAVEALGMRYHHLPMPGGQLSAEQVDEMTAILEAADGKVLAYCLSGMRSAVIWMFSQAKTQSADELVIAAANAGYNLGHLKGALEQFS